MRNITITTLSCYAEIGPNFHTELSCDGKQRPKATFIPAYNNREEAHTSTIFLSK